MSARLRPFAWPAVLLVLAFACAACGGGGTADPPAAQAAQGAFPVSIPHRYGSAEIPTAPQRVVTVGLVEQDAALALGLVPVATTEWFGGYPGAIHPWAQDELGNAALPQVLTDQDGIQFERIAALDPDLILAMYSGITESDYQTLSRIAPTVAQPAAFVDYGVPWQEVTRTVGTALGKAERAEQLVADVEARFAQERAEHPALTGATGLVTTPFEGYYVYGPQDPRSRFLGDLGLEVPAAIGELAGDQFGTQISRERLDLLDTDVLIWIVEGDVGRESIQADPLYASFDVVTQGRDIFVNDQAEPVFYGATSFQTVLSLPLLLDELVPRMTAAVDGDPTTTVTP